MAPAPASTVSSSRIGTLSTSPCRAKSGETNHEGICVGGILDAVDERGECDRSGVAGCDHALHAMKVGRWNRLGMRLPCNRDGVAVNLDVKMLARTALRLGVDGDFQVASVQV